MRDRRAEYIDAALEVLDEEGPTLPSFGWTVAQLCRATSLNRSVVYRNWDTTDELNQDILMVQATEPRGWQPQLLRAPIDVPLVDALRHALGGPLEDLSTYALGLVAGWPGSHPARAEVQRVERTWLAELGPWLVAHLAAEGRTLRPSADARTVAVAVSAAIHGHLLVWLATADLSTDRWTDEDRTILAERLDRMLRQVTTEAPRRVVQPTMGPEPDLSPRQVLLADALRSLRVEGPVECRLTAPSRLVSVARLGRRLGVHERRLYAMWPTASEMNTEIVAAVAARERAVVDDVLRRTIAQASQRDGRSIGELLVRACDVVVCLPLETLPTHMFTCGQAMSDPIVHASFSGPFRAWMDDMRTVFLAGLALSGRTCRPEVAIDEAAASLRETAMGMRRLAAMHPDLIDERVPGHRDLPLAGVAPLLAVSGALEPLGHEPRGRGGGI